MRNSRSTGYLCILAALLLSIPVAAATATATAEDPPIPTFGCSWSADSPTVITVVDDDGTEREQEVEIKGSLVAPYGVDDDDQRTLRRLASVGRDEAVRIARAAIDGGDKRRLGDVELEIEQGYIVWGIELRLGRGQSSPDPNVEVIVDAGNGRVLTIECEEEDD
jgi:uncharacterized membrane protein YkoI